MVFNCALGDGQIRSSDACKVPHAKRPLSANLPPGTPQAVYDHIRSVEADGRAGSLRLHGQCRFLLYASASAAPPAAPPAALPLPLPPPQTTGKHPMEASPEAEGKKPGGSHRSGLASGFLLPPPSRSASAGSSRLQSAASSSTCKMGFTIVFCHRLSLHGFWLQI